MAVVMVASPAVTTAAMAAVMAASAGIAGAAGAATCNMYSKKLAVFDPRSDCPQRLSR